MDITIYSQAGKAVETVTLPKEIFEVAVNDKLIQRAIVRQLANARHPIAHTKNRAERQGSTRKLYKQKGTGRARPGDARTPNRKKGGVSMGPRNERNFEISMSKGEQRCALFSSLTLRARDEAIVGLESYTGEMKTKNFTTLLSALPLKKKVLIVVPEKNELIEKSSRNLPNVKVILANYLNPYDIIHNDSIIFLKASLPQLSETFLKQPKVVEEKA